MVNVLLNYYNFEGDWARPHLEKYVVGRKVLIIPLAFRDWQCWDNDSWHAVYGKGGEKYDSIIAPFLAYGYKESELEWLNCYDDKDHLVQVQNATLLFFTGGMPEKAIARMEEMGIKQAVIGFDGVVMGASAGAMLQLDDYHTTPDDDYKQYDVWRGLGLVRGFDVEVHYLATDLQNQCTARAVKQFNMPVYQMWHEGGLLVEGDKVTVMGKVEKILP